MRGRERNIYKIEQLISGSDFNELYHFKNGDFEIITFSHDNENEKNKLEKYRKKVSSSDKHKRIANYAKNMFELDEQIAFTVSKYKKELIGFSTIYHRDVYGEKNYRCLNRFYLDENFRDLEIVYGHTYIMLQQQINFSKDYTFENIFVTREPPKLIWFKRWTELANQFTNTTWLVLPNIYLVCPAPNAKSCWQHISVCNLDNQDHTLPFENITTEEWRERFIS